MADAAAGTFVGNSDSLPAGSATAPVMIAVVWASKDSAGKLSLPSDMTANPTKYFIAEMMGNALDLARWMVDYWLTTYSTQIPDGMSIGIYRAT